MVDNGSRSAGLHRRDIKERGGINRVRYRRVLIVDKQSGRWIFFVGLICGIKHEI